MYERREQWIHMLEAEWSKPDGYLGRIREGIFDEQRADDFVAMLAGIRLSPSDTVIDRRLVALIWYIPIFLSFQKERIAEREGDVASFEQMTNRVHGMIEEILGVP
ncbi:MAG TPA: hypothetical protein VL101_03945 [Nordella sp.]|nr:hypothetical protein [Nordella sp.]